MDAEEIDEQVRAAAFAFLTAQTSIFGATLPRAVLQRGFEFGGRRVPLVGPQGIFKPEILPEMPLSITTSLHGPYSDEVNADGTLQYRYRGTDPRFHENVRLRLAMSRQVPLVYFSARAVGEYAAVFPVYVLQDDPATLTFTVDTVHSGVDVGGVGSVNEPQRRYAAQVVNRRLHQADFSANVMTAYRKTCTICRLRHRELLDAAHILPDSDPLSRPVVSNGLALCKLHHAAFDNHILGVRPDLVIEVRSDVLDEIDGPMLRHGLQGFQGESLLIVPRDRSLRPDPVLLEERYARFRQAS